MTAVIVALLSATAAFACGAYAWLTKQQEKRRSEARVAALAAAIDPPRIRDATPRIERATAQGLHPLLTIAVGFGVVAAVIVLVALTADALERRPLPATHPTPRRLIELRTMGHLRQGNALVVSGEVRNQGDVETDRLTAEVVVLDEAGHPAGSGRAPIDSAALSPGAISRFKVRIDGVHTVGRYRVSFQDSTGIVRHVDARQRVTSDAVRNAPAANRSATASSGF